jgi:hypothetical protein
MTLVADLIAGLWAMSLTGFVASASQLGSAVTAGIAADAANAGDRTTFVTRIPIASAVRMPVNGYNLRIMMAPSE